MTDTPAEVSQADDASVDVQNELSLEMSQSAGKDLTLAHPPAAPEQPTLQEPPMSDSDRRKLNGLKKKVTDLEISIEGMQKEKDDLKQKLKDDNPARTVKHHIHLLHRYNEIKDVGMGLLGMIAEQRGVRVKDVMEEFGLGHKD